MENVEVVLAIVWRKHNDLVKEAERSDARF